MLIMIQYRGTIASLFLFFSIYFSISLFMFTLELD